MSFTYDIATTLGRVRLALTDTNQDTAVFSDEEIQVFLDECNGEVDCATFKLLRVLKAAAAIRGDAARVSAIDEVMNALPVSDVLSNMPIMDTVYPAPFPMDDAYQEVDGG